MRNLAYLMFSTLMIGLISGSFAATEVKLSGSTTVLPLGEAIAEAFNSEQEDYHASVTGGGTGAGITAIAEGRSDIAMASREITSDEQSKYGNKFSEFLVGYDGIGIAVSKSIFDAGVRALTNDQVKDIYSGNIKNWDEVGGPDREIYVISREQGSGTRDTFNEVVMGDKAADTPGVATEAASSAEVKTAITGSDKAIGYLGYSYVESGDAKAVTLDGVSPTVDTIKSGEYELARKLYLYVFGEPSAGVKAYLDFATGQHGQKIASDKGFIPV